MATAVVHHETPRAGLVISTTLSIVSIAILAVCLSRRFNDLKSWRKFTLTKWLTLAIYVDSTLFVFITAVLAHGFGLNSSEETCSMAILLCLASYMSTKILIYYYLVEKVYIVNEVDTPRMKSKMYLFNCFGMLVPYCIVVVLNFVYRISSFNSSGLCIIGMEKKAMLPLIIFDVIVNIYLTALFVMPLRALYSFKNPDSKLRVITFRTFIGSCTTLTSSVINLTILMVLRGEPAWICLMCCNIDILFSTVVLHWVTSKDTSKRKTDSDLSTGVSTCHRCNPPPSAFINTFHQDKGFSGDNSTGPGNSIRSAMSLDEEAGLGHDSISECDSVGVHDFAPDEKIHIHMHTIFEMRNSSADGINKDIADVANAMEANKKRRRDSRWGWDKDVETGGEVKPCRWRRYSLR